VQQEAARASARKLEAAAEAVQKANVAAAVERRIDGWIAE
jgi:hypothetical protein